MLRVHRAESGEVLVHALAQVLAEAPSDPFAPDLVAVPAKGVERWIAQRLSHTLGAVAGDGVCAHVEFPRPGDVLDGAVRAASAQHAASVERWAPERAVWPLLDAVDASLGEPGFTTLTHHLRGRDERDKGRRLATAGRLVRFFTEYGRARPAMLQDWVAGRDEDGSGLPLDPDLLWQAELWRRLRERIGVPAPAELLADACVRLRADPSLARLPERLSVFGASRISPARLEVLAALAEHRDVHLWLHHPSPQLWEAVAQAPPAVRRREDETRLHLRNPFLASMSRDLVELQQQLRRVAPAAVDEHHPLPGPRPATLLGRLQQQVAEDEAHAVLETPAPITPGDLSVQVHACHGRMRQVEVLREVVLGLLAADRTLEPRDILVMCPDVEAFAPLVGAAFSLGAPDDAGHPAARLRVRLADRSLKQTNPVLEVLVQVLRLGTARISAPEVLDLAGLAAVRRRFRFDDDDLERLREWVVGSGARWGLDAEHRSTWRLAGVDVGTWRVALDRLLVGVALEDDLHALGTVVPLDDVDSSDIDLAGRLAELLDRVAEAQRVMSGRHRIGHWAGELERVTLLLADTTRRDSWQKEQLRRELKDLAEAAGARFPAVHGPGVPAPEAAPLEAEDGEPLGLADVRALIEAEFAGRPTRASFRTGTLTVCTLVPMRSVPHRVICLLGLDDGTFPRQSVRDGDDVLARDPWAGERDPRSEDRQLLLDAIGAAGEHLVVTYAGFDERTGAKVPPAVPLGELLDALDRTATAPDGAPVREVVVTRHPLQPFDIRNFQPGGVTGREVGRGPFSFDHVGLAAALAASGVRTAPGPFLPGPLARRPAADVDLADLHRMLIHPTRGFLRQRLDLAVTRPEEDPAEAVSVEYDSLQKWALGERLLRQRLAGMEPAECMALESRRGLLPPGPLGASLLSTVGREVDRLVGATGALREVVPDTVDVDVPLPDGTRVTGTVGNVRGDLLLAISYSSLGAKHRLAAWIDLLAISAGRPGPPWHAVTVGKHKQGARCAELAPVPAGEARATLAELVELYRAGLEAPLPLALKTGLAYAERRSGGSRPVAALIAADGEWSGQKFGGERDDHEHVLVHGPAAEVGVLTAAPPLAEETGEGWAADEEHRFGRLARRVWDRMLAAERVDVR